MIKIFSFQKLSFLFIFFLYPLREMAPGIHWRKKRKKWYLALLNFCRLLIRKFGAFRWMHPRKGYWGVFIWENSHRREFHTGMTFWFRIAFTWWLSHFISRYLKVHFMLIKIHAWFKIANITHELPVPVYRQTKFTPKSVVVSLRDFVPEWNSRPGTATGVTRAGMTFCGSIM